MGRPHTLCFSLPKLTVYSTDDAEYLFSSGYSFVRDRSIDKDLFVNVPALFKLDIARWTTVPLSNSLLNHLLALFWTWDNSVERLIYRPMFEDDLVAMHPYEDDHQKRRFCSPFLVNALLALGCVSTQHSFIHI